MHLAYYDEAGDDGYPDYSSPLFVLTAVYLEHLTYRICFEQIRNFRNQINQQFGFPTTMEMHTRDFLTDKNPFYNLHISPRDRIQIINDYCSLLRSLNVRIINIVIVKTLVRSDKFNVLDTALRFSVQRIENDLDHMGRDNERFMIISDQGRISLMRKTTRKIQKLNFVPSMYTGSARRLEIKRLVEDPLPKDSKDSYFIQLADLVSYIVYIHSVTAKGVAAIPNRLSSYVSNKQIEQWMDMLKPAFNLKACPRNPYGIKYFPGA
jgi:hypothetical protein